MLEYEDEVSVLLFLGFGGLSRATHLREDFSEKNDKYGRQTEANQSRGQVRHEDRDQRIDCDIPEQQRAQKQIALQGREERKEDNQ